VAKQIEGVYEKVLECAKVEFLEKGFQEASLRTIAQNAETSTGSIYTRFSDKAGLFEALVLPVVDELKCWFSEEQEKFHLRANDQKNDFSQYSKDKNLSFIDYVYQNFDVFKLLISCSDGTIFSNFVHDIVEVDVHYTVKFIETTENDALVNGRASLPLLHILSSAYYSGVFETVVHNMSKEDAVIYTSQLRRFFLQGWKDIFYRKGVDDD